MVDQIAAFMRHLTSDPTTRLYCSLAGGRKTQSVLLGFALQLYGRRQDTLLHVLVDEALQNHPEFFYPTKVSRVLCTRDGRKLDARTARVDVAEIPYLRLRDKLFKDETHPEAGVAPTIAQGQRTLDALPSLSPLVIIWSARCIRIGPTEIVLPPLRFVLYAHLAQLRMQQERDGFITLHELEAMQDVVMQRYASLYSPHSGRVARLRETWARGMPHDSVRSHFVTINDKIREALQDTTLAFFYQVDSARLYGNTRYGLRLPPEHIELRED